MDSVTVSQPSSNPETKKRKRNRKKHMVKDVALQHEEPAVNTSVESGLIEEQSNPSPSQKITPTNKQQGMKENTNPNWSSPTVEASLQSGSHVDPAVNTTAESVLIKPVTGLSRSQKKRLAKKRRKQEKMQENSELNGSSTIEPPDVPADAGEAKDMVGVSLDKDHCTSTEKRNRKKKKRKLDPEDSSLTVEAPAEFSVVAGDLGTSTEVEKKNKTKKKKRDLDPEHSSPTIEFPAEVSVAGDLPGVSLGKDLCTSTEVEKKKKTKKKKKLDPDDSSPTIETPAEVSIAGDLAGVSLDKDLCTSTEVEKKKKTKKKKELDPEDSSPTIETPAEVSVAGVSLDKDLGTSTDVEKKKETKKKRKHGSDDSSPTIEAQTDVSLVRDLSEVSLDKDLGTSAENGKRKKTKKKEKLDPYAIEASTDVSLERDMAGVSLDNDLCTSTENEKQKKTKKKKRKLDPDDNSLTIEAPADVSIARDLTVVPLDKDLCTSTEEVKRKKTKKDKKRKIDPDDCSLTIEARADVAGVSLDKKIAPSSIQLSVTEDNIDLDAIAKEERLPPKSQLSPERALILPPKKKKLLILDINGILVDIPQGSSKGKQPDFRVSGGRAAFTRPHCQDFLRFCFERFNVGVWSSRVKWNLLKAVDELMRDFKGKLLFKWDRSHCTMTKIMTLENDEKPIVFKELKKLWEKSDRYLPWDKGDFNESNTLLVDDSPYKALCNPAHTAIFPYPYEHTDKTDSLLGPGSDFRVYLERLAEADDVQKFVEQNSFGQPAITETHPRWGFYSDVIKSAETKDQDQSQHKRQKRSYNPDFTQ